jgi:hypothetical protein
MQQLNRKQIHRMLILYPINTANDENNVQILQFL